MNGEFDMVAWLAAVAVFLFSAVGWGMVAWQWLAFHQDGAAAVNHRLLRIGLVCFAVGAAGVAVEYL